MNARPIKNSVFPSNVSTSTLTCKRSSGMTSKARLMGKINDSPETVIPVDHCA